MAQTPSWRRRPLLGLVLLLVLVAAAYLAGTGGADPTASPATLPTTTSSSAPASSPAATGSEPGSSSAPFTDPNPGLSVVAAADLPPEARDTLALIATDGPYLHEQDGGEFFNRESLLPDHDDGWYREFTVQTPGEDDRGARRIVTGRDGTTYYTADHYESFVVVADP